MVVKAFQQIQLPVDPAAALQAATRQYADAPKAPAAHASTHASGGSDPVTPAAINAYTKLFATAVKTSAYTTADGEIVTCDDSGGGFTVTLPSATFGTVVGVRKFSASANTVTVQRAGTDTIGASGATSVQLKLLDQVIVLHAVGGLWLPLWDQIGLPTLDARFQPLDSDLTQIASQTATTNNFLVGVSSAWTSVTPSTAKTALALAKGDVGLGNVDNTSNATERAATRTLTNARITTRVGTTASSSTPTADADNNDQYNVTALAAAATFGVPTGTPTDGQMLLYRIKDNGTARTLAWNAVFRALGVVLPTTTVVSKTLYVGTIWNAADSVWDVIAVAQQA